MKKGDYILILVIIFICSCLLLVLNNKKRGQVATVYYNNDIVLTVALDKQEEYIVKGYLGNVIIETDIGRIRVKEETSPRHLCSIQGWVSNSYTPIVCLPNKIIIKIEDDTSIDTVVR